MDEIEDAARKHRGISQIAPEDVDTYHKVISDIAKKLEPEAVPCMPVIIIEMKAAAAAASKKPGTSSTSSNDSLFDRSACREESYDAKSQGGTRRRRKVRLQA